MKTQPKLVVQPIPIGEIKPYWRNARKNDKTVRALASSIMRYGFNVPIILDSNKIIIAGHARYKACLSLAYKEIPCIISNMSEADAKEYRIADNKVAELTQWDKAQLEQEVKEIGNNEFLQSFFDLDFAANFFNVEIEKEQPEENRQNNMVYNAPTYNEQKEESSAPTYPDRRDYPAKEGDVIIPPKIYAPQQQQYQVGQGDMERAQEKIDTVVSDKIERKESNLLEMICPCCNEPFWVEKLWLQRKLSGEFALQEEISKFKE